MLMNTGTITVLCFMLIIPGIARAQTAPPAAPNPQKASADTGGYAWWARAGMTCATGASAAATTVALTVQCGALMSMPFFDLETGVMGPQAKHSSVSGYLSTNFWIPLIAPSTLGNAHGVPLAVGGYTRMFETGNALDYGLAFARPTDASHSIQFEVRDYWVFSNPDQHNVVFRVVWLLGLPD
jgi:hypothetical protein